VGRAETLRNPKLKQSASKERVAACARLGVIARHFQFVYNLVVGLIYIKEYSKKTIQFFYS